MGDKSAIEWTDATWNPVRGCEKISPGCKHCYAETFAERFRGVPGHPYEQGFDVRLVPDALGLPLRWRKPRTIFVNSMSDLFQVGVPIDFIARAFAVMALAPRHTFQVLTKRAARMREELSDASFYARVLDAADREFRPARPELRSIGITRPPARNVWLGVSVEDRKYGLPRVEELRQTPAAVRFLSVEPLLEDLGELDLRGIDWVIVGGESGLGARSMQVEWVRSIRDQCAATRVPFFFKQWGGLRKKVAGRLLDGRTWDETPANLNARELPS
jgi:protein gp37